MYEDSFLESAEDRYQEDPITDQAGYLDCGCHGSRREHTCQDREYPEYDLSQEI